MNASKKLDRFRQWGREKMGADVKTTNSEEFKNLEQEMDARHEGMEKLHDSMSSYVKYLSKLSEDDGKDKITPIALLAATMIRHGQELEAGSVYGWSLAAFGETHERVSRIQESYAVKAKSSWLDSCARTLVMLKDYQSARKKLMSRRLAYDSSLAKMHRSKKEDFKTEDEIRAQKAKYEESVDEVTRRMEDICETDHDNLINLQVLLDAEIHYHAKCRDVLQQLKRDMPLPSADEQTTAARRPQSRAGSLYRFESSSSDEDSSCPPKGLNGARVTALSRIAVEKALTKNHQPAKMAPPPPPPPSRLLKPPMARSASVASAA